MRYSMSLAIYVHSVVGAHTANPMSGDFSVEMSNPFWVRDGELAEPIRGAMLTGNFFDLHRQVTVSAKRAALWDPTSCPR